MADKDPPKYDVAISFLAKDIDDARGLYEHLSGLNVFFFPRNQEDLAGTDGLESMRSAFRFDSRINVVMYRAGWGETPWTRVEKTAITERCLADGWRTLFFITLEKRRPGDPPWLPETHISLSWKDYGADQAAGAIKARVQELGGYIHTESLEEKSTRLSRARAYQTRRETFARSYEGVKAANEAFAALKEELKKRFSDLKDNLPITVKEDSQGPLVIFGFASPLRLVWAYHYSNSLDEAKLRIETWRGHPEFTGTWSIDSSRTGNTEYPPDVSPEGKAGWAVGGKILGPAEFADQLIGENIERTIAKVGKRR